MKRSRFLLLLGMCLPLGSCYYAPDIKNQTAGSFVGGMYPGIGLVQSSVTSTSAGVIGGSILGSAFGQYYDNYSLLNRDDPIYSPLHRYYYQVVRADLQVQCFKSGRIFYRGSSRLPHLTHTQPPVNQLD